MSSVAKKVVTAQPPSRKAEVASYAYELESLKPIGAEIIEIDGSSSHAFLEGGARDADAIMTSWGVRIDKDIITQLEKCVVISLGSVGVDMVDIEAATEAGIVVTNVPDVFIEEVADHTMMLLLSAARRTKLMNKLVTQGDWKKGRSILYKTQRLLGQTLGLFSFGHVARAVARRAKAFGFNVIAHDPYVSELTMTSMGIEPVTFDNLLEKSDYLSLHPPARPETEHVFGKTQFEKMKSTAVLINTSRGSVVDETALVKALDKEQIAGAALDVLEHEPPDKDNPLLYMDNVVITPHSAPATDRMIPVTRRRVGQEVAMVLMGRWPMSCVNPSVLPRVKLERWQPYPMDRGPGR